MCHQLCISHLHVPFLVLLTFWWGFFSNHLPSPTQKSLEPSIKSCTFLHCFSSDSIQFQIILSQIHLLNPKSTTTNSIVASHRFFSIFLSYFSDLHGCLMTKTNSVVASHRFFLISISYFYDLHGCPMMKIHRRYYPSNRFRKTTFRSNTCSNFEIL